jgi:hypothetical protein
MPASWLAPIDSYCERLDAGFWAEPLNAATNAAFLAAACYALHLWRRAGMRDWPSLWLIAMTAIVGIGSFLFHTFANRWSLLADVLPITVFIYSYFLLAVRRFLGLEVIVAVVATLLFAGFNLPFTHLWFMVLPGVGLNGSVSYLPAAFAMLGVGGVCLIVGRKGAGTALVVAGCIFSLSLLFRSVDVSACAAWPPGTHFLWHVLNALVLGILMKASIDHKGAAHGQG